MRPSEGVFTMKIPSLGRTLSNGRRLARRGQPAASTAITPRMGSRTTRPRPAGGRQPHAPRSCRRSAPRRRCDQIPGLTWQRRPRAKRGAGSRRQPSSRPVPLASPRGLGRPCRPRLVKGGQRYPHDGDTFAKRHGRAVGPAGSRGGGLGHPTWRAAVDTMPPVRRRAIIADGPATVQGFPLVNQAMASTIARSISLGHRLATDSSTRAGKSNRTRYCGALRINASTGTTRPRPTS
jgi:hypothetical protein